MSVAHLATTSVSSFAGIANENEFYSHHYLAEVFKGDIKALIESWQADLTVRLLRWLRAHGAEAEAEKIVQFLGRWPNLSPVYGYEKARHAAARMDRRFCPHATQQHWLLRGGSVLFNGQWRTTCPICGIDLPGCENGPPGERKEYGMF